MFLSAAKEYTPKKLGGETSVKLLRFSSLLMKRRRRFVWITGMLMATAN